LQRKIEKFIIVTLARISWKLGVSPEALKASAEITPGKLSEIANSTVFKRV